ncbi:unnamed protein product [Polarella glacialis]|uniref:Uncharacterized protein n=1 Tax=Polarella glacialis TaxID=89957 RepID=A0A813DFH4_POLGL|nr:unnamed protein product [Polarella glacialis]CAE8688723.1 unnamed protein product [Polarella glacialis]
MALGRVLSGLGPSNLAALGLGHRVEALAYTVCEGFGAAASTIVGQWLGAGYEKEARHAAAHAAKFTAWVMVPLSVVMVLFPVPIVSVFTSDPVTVAASASYLRIIGFLAPAMGVEHVMDGALIGAGDTLPSLIWGLLLCLARLAAAIWLSGRFGVAGVWWAISLSTAVKAVLKSWAFQKSRLPLLAQRRQ